MAPEPQRSLHGALAAFHHGAARRPRRVPSGAAQAREGQSSQRGSHDGVGGVSDAAARRQEVGAGGESARRGFSFSFARRLSETYGFCFQVEFQGEEGTGLGPTLEFYALIAAEFQRTSLGIWLCDDDFPDDESRQVRRRNRLSRVFVCSTSETTRINRLLDQRIPLMPSRLCSGGPGRRSEASGLLCAALLRPLPGTVPSGQRGTGAHHQALPLPGHLPGQVYPGQPSGGPPALTALL